MTINNITNKDNSIGKMMQSQRNSIIVRSLIKISWWYFFIEDTLSDESK